MIRFDEAVLVALDVASHELGDGAKGATVVRDTLGRISVIVGPMAEADLTRAAAALDARLGAYSPGSRAVLLTRDDLIDPNDVLQSPDRVRLFDRDAWLVDRLLTNQDWLREPIIKEPPLPIAVGFSVKGGVGRTTALAAWAWHLARKGKRVVIIDFDLEAPALATMLLEQPAKYGVIDWLAEDLVGQSTILPPDDLTTDSPLARDLPGALMVMGAAGTETKDYVPKLGRVLMPGGADGRETLAHRMLRLFEQLKSGLGPDAILVDARAGLHDLAAAAVTQIGADVFLFARDERQDWDAWRHLFSHLSRARAVHYGGPTDDLRWRLKMVGAQVGAGEDDKTRLLDRSHELWTELYDEEGRPPSRPFSFTRDEPSAPHYPFRILFESQIRGRRLADPRERPDWKIIEFAFNEFLVGATARMFADQEESE